MSKSILCLQGFLLKEGLSASWESIKIYKINHTPGLIQRGGFPHERPVTHSDLAFPQRDSQGGKR